MSMATRHRLVDVTLLLLIFFSQRVCSYEKTLRTIVRNRSKMVQRPFSDAREQTWTWDKTSAQSVMADSIINPGFSQTKVFHRIQRPKVSTIMSSLDTGRGKSVHSRIMSANIIENDLRRSRYISPNNPPPQTFKGNEYRIDHKQYNADTHLTNISIESYYEIPTQPYISKFFPATEDQELQSIELKDSKEQTIVFPKISVPKGNGSALLKSIYMAHKNNSDKTSVVLPPSEGDRQVSEVENNKPDFLLHGTPVHIESLYSYNASASPYSCKVLQQAEADIDAQLQFSSFDIEPPWSVKKQYWNSIFDSRYESLLRKNKWPPLKVILVPRTHVDSFWKKSFEQYHTDSVSKILSNIVKKLQFYSNLTFTWNEVSHLSRWWKSTSHKSRSAFKKLVKSGRLEITTGGWVESDEATTHIFGLVHQLVEGHEWLKYNLNYSPKTAWLTYTVTHSPTMTYLLSALDISQLVTTKLHFAWEYYLAEYQLSEFVWVQSWDRDNSVSTELNGALDIIGSDRYCKHSVMTHYLQFNSAGFIACGPKMEVCSNDFNFAKSIKNIGINDYNVKEKSESLLEQYSKSGTLTPHNTIIAPIGGPYNYEYQAEFDFQYNNYQKIVDFVNFNSKIYKASIEFGTPEDYFKTIYKKYKKYQTLKGDFLNFADIDSGTPAYWTGFYTSRPFFKIMLRRLESTMRSTEILFSFALSLNVFRDYKLSRVYEMLIKCRENLGRLLDRNVVSGTLPANVLRQAHGLILRTAKDCWHIQELAASFLTSKPELNKPYLQKYVFREGEFISTFKTVSPEDHIYIFNSLSHERTEVIELVTRHPNIRVLDHSRREVTVQINPIWKYGADNVIAISKRFFKITFAVQVPPMALMLFKIKTTYDATNSAATIYCSVCVVEDIPEIESAFPFNIQPIEIGDIQLESYKHRLVFDELTGFLKTVIEKETNIAKSVVIDFGAFRDADVNSGMFLFNTNVSKPLDDILMPYRIGSKTRITMITSGRITTEISNVFGRFLQHTVKVFNLVHSPLSNAIYIESKVDYEVSPKNRDLELFMSIKTEIANGNPPQIYTDNNGFQHTAKVINISRRIESNLYPITSMAYLQDRRNRLTYLTDHAQGVTALQEGQLVVMLDRRVLYDDGRGANEGLADSSATCHRQFILLENFIDGLTHRPNELSLPSLSAVHLANGLNYLLDIFTVKQNSTGLCHYGFLPLIKMSFPCDISIINFRVILTGGGHRNVNPQTALLILHRRSFSCRIDTSTFLRCDGELEFSLDKIISNVRAVYLTNLAGTNKGTPLLTFTATNFLPMELATVRLYF